MVGFMDLATKAILDTTKKIADPDFKNKHTKKNDFLRNRKMNFEKLMAFLLQRNTGSYDAKLLQLMDKLKEDMPECITKQAISKARQKIEPDAFCELFKITVAHFMKSENCKDKWKQYNVYAVDGTDVDLPSNTAVLDKFGFAKSRFGTKTAKASASLLYDVKNDVILEAVIQPYKTSERRMAMEMLKSFQSRYSMDNTVVIFDRGYPSYELMQYLISNHILFLMRVKKECFKLIDKDNNDITVIRRVKGKDLKLRLLNVMLSSGECEYLITNIHDSSLCPDDFYELYFKRWGIESKYRELKNRYKLEEFSGSSITSIIQDFFINLFLSNICAFIKRTADLQIQKEMKKRNRTKIYQSNRSVIVTITVQSIMELLLYPGRTDEKIQYIVELAMKKRSQIRPNRNYERNKNVNRRKHWMNNKSCF